MEKNNTCSMSPLAKASTTLVGMMFITYSVVVCILPGPTYLSIPLVSSVLGSTFMPTPGCQTLTTTKPMISAIVLTTSKYRTANPPFLPTFFISSMPAMPTTMVQKMIGAMIILISLMKASPSGFMSAPADG